MYDSNGEYGKVRIADLKSEDKDKTTLFLYDRTFWHSCNDLYCIRRPSGCENYLIMVTLDGSATLEIEDNSYDLTCGAVAIIRPGTPHNYYCNSGSTWTFYGIHIVNNFVSPLLERLIEENSCYFMHQNPRALSDILEHIIVESQINSFVCSPEISALISDFIHMLFKRKEQTVQNKSKSLFEKSLKYIEANYASDISIDKISAEMFVSTPHFIRVFRQYAGITPHQYLENYRMLQARILLCNTRMSINEVAFSVGYKNTSNFIAHFKKHKGTTPAEYRKNLANFETPLNLPPPYYTKDNKPVDIKYKIY